MACNARKFEQDFRDFLAGDHARTAAIEAHMVKYGYRPIVDHEQLREIIDLAHQDVRHLADRYAAIINTVLRGEESDQDQTVKPTTATATRPSASAPNGCASCVLRLCSPRRRWTQGPKSWRG